MSTLPEMSHPQTAPPPVLIGVLIDVSNSMRRNWRNKGGKKLPRIKVIKDALNKRIKEEQRLQQSKEAIVDDVILTREEPKEDLNQLSFYRSIRLVDAAHEVAYPEVLKEIKRNGLKLKRK
jgi:hypothetical protein